MLFLENCLFFVHIKIYRTKFRTKILHIFIFTINKNILISFNYRFSLFLIANLFKWNATHKTKKIINLSKWSNRSISKDIIIIVNLFLFTTDWLNDFQTVFKLDLNLNSENNKDIDNNNNEREEFNTLTK